MGTRRRRCASSAAAADRKGAVVPDAGFAIDLLPGRGLQRRLTLANIGVFVETIVAFVRAIRLVRQYRPSIVVGFGGYASLPCVVAAWIWRIPRIVHEQDSVIGLANRIGVRLGARVAASLPGVEGAEVVFTGNPVRAEFRDLVRTRQEPPLVAVFGGALGARFDQPGDARAVRPLARPHGCRGPPRDGSPQRSGVRGAARGAAPDRRRARVRARRLRAAHAAALRAGDRRGVPGRRGHGRRAHGRGRAGGARAACRARRATTRPATRRRSRGPARPSSCPTRNATRRGSTRVVTELLAAPDRLDAMASAARVARTARRRGPARRPRRGSAPR